MTEPDSYSAGNVPVFRPSMAEFSDFEKYMKSINKYGMQSGIVKVIPPKEWIQSLPKITHRQLKTIKIRNPIVQHISGNNGVFGQQNVEKQRTYNIVQWKALSEEPNYQPPAPRGKTRPVADARTAKRNKQILSNKNHNDDSLFTGFKYNIDTSEFTEERCEQLEKVYWKSLLYADPVYGADMLGSIFDESVKVWNVAHLPNLLDHMEQKLPGVNEAYLYAGLWKATFSWHLEDQDLYSINYLHFGAPKQWYSIPQEDKDKFDRVMRETFPQEYDNCHDFLRHKTFLVSPSFLESRGVKVNKIVHYEQEFMITYPYGYHAGMNFGYNLAESVNFAIDDWFEYGMKTSKCMCISDAVGIDVPRLRRRYYGEPDPEPEVEPVPESKATTVRISNDESTAAQVASKSESVKRRKVETKKPIKEKPKIKPPSCLLCPNILSERQQKHENFKLIPVQTNDNGTSKVTYCHKLCASRIPELTIVYDIDSSSSIVEGLDKVPKARKNLKCLYCHEKQGACFQCSHPSCTRSFHGTCALPAGVFFKNHEEQYCKVHRAKHDKIDRYLKSLTIGDTIQAKFEEYFAGVIISNNKSENSFDVELYPIAAKNADRLEVEVPYSAVKTQGIAFHKNVKKGKPIKMTPDEDDDVVEILTLDDFLRHTTAVEESHGRKWVLEKVKVIESEDTYEQDHPLWYYKPNSSTDNIARYSDDVLLDEPNDPKSLKTRERKEAKLRRELKKSQSPFPPSSAGSSSSVPSVEANYTLTSAANSTVISLPGTMNPIPIHLDRSPALRDSSLILLAPKPN